MKKPFFLKGKKPQEILQIKFTTVKSIIKFEINYKISNLSTLCMSHSLRKISLFFSPSHTLFFFLTALTTKPYSLFTTMHIASSLSFLLHFATLIKVSQILIDLCALQNFKFFVNNTQILLSLPLHYLPSKNLISWNSLVFHTKTTQK